MTIWTVPAVITRVIDGDTLEANLDLGWGVWHMKAKVRLARVNAPELRAPLGPIAKAAVEGWVAEAGPRVVLTSRSLDKYGRTLADVWLSDGNNLSDMLIKGGYSV